MDESFHSIPVNHSDNLSPPPNSINPPTVNPVVPHIEPAKPVEPVAASIDSSDLTVSVNPVPIVKVLSVRGVEYAMLTITLWLNAAAILWILLALVNGGAKFVILDVPLSIAIISVPIFAILFIRRKKAELADPTLKLEPSKRRSTQFTQIAAFVATLANLIAFVYAIIAHFAGQLSYSIGKAILDELIILVVTGGILAYYWHDEHKSRSV